MLDSQNLGEIDELKSQIQQLKTNEENFQQITENIKEVFFIIDSQTDEICYVSPAYEKVWGRSCKSLYESPQSWLLAIHPDDCSEAMGTLETQFRTGEEFQEEYRIIRPDNSICWVRVRAFPVRNLEEKVDRFVGIAEDITLRKNTETALRQTEEHFRLIFEQASIGIAVTNLSGKFLKVNPAFCQMLAYSEPDLFASTFKNILQVGDDKIHRKIIDRLIQFRQVEDQLEVCCQTKSQEIIDVLLKIVVIYDEFDQPINLQYQLIDITDRKRMEQQLVYDALHDPLTELPNRVLFTDRLMRAIIRCKARNDYCYAVLFLDIDRFKVVNDGLGHLAGDELLILVTKRLLKVLRPIDTIARFGGDEFVILLDEDCDRQTAIQIADKLQCSLDNHFEIEGNRIFVSISIGITLSTNQYERPEDILRDADATMYKAKDKGRARYEVFDESLRAAALNRLKLENELRTGLLQNQFCLFYQPIIDVESLEIKGFEALVRWFHPVHGMVSPSDFIPVAEETGLIIALGEMIFEMACQQLTDWHQEQFDLSHLKLSINLSGKQLMDPHLLGVINRVMSRPNIGSQRIKLEITESILLEQDYQAINVLNNLRESGFEISLDDFGTGYSSLSYLQRLPIDTLKIDRSFIQKIQHDVQNKNLAIVQSIITLSHAIGLNVIAEGVETQEQLDKLATLGCEFVQGYFFSPPVDSVRASEFLRKRIIEM
ncbi:MAG: EAL domain-containing protein [Limnothrix sp. RL_2_0]|nr:EAL domain-containing protein [Limnothrix sp. RL_2_0]